MYGSYSISRSWVFRIILITSAVFILQYFQSRFVYYDVIVTYLGLNPANVVNKGFVWQLFTYMLPHRDFMHLFFNMYGLFLFGVMVEEAWGGKKFIIYYLFCGTGAGISIFLLNLIMGNPGFTIGASGAVFGLLFAFGYLFPDLELLLFFVVPVKAKYLVVFYGVFELYQEFSGGMSDVSHIGHLGGLFFGIVYVLVFERGRWFKRKVKNIVQKAERPGGEGLRLVPRRDTDQEMKKEIIRKLEEKGSFDALTDDEFQFVKYLDIMAEPGSVKGAHSIDVTDEYISDSRFLETIRKYQQ